MYLCTTLIANLLPVMYMEGKGHISNERMDAIEDLDLFVTWTRGTAPNFKLRLFNRHFRDEDEDVDASAVTDSH